MNIRQYHHITKSNEEPLHPACVLCVIRVLLLTKLLIFSLSECLQCAKQFLYFEKLLDTMKVAQKVAIIDQTRKTQGNDII